MRQSALSMYDLPYLRTANNLLWSEMAKRLKRAGISNVPDTLTRGQDQDELWCQPEMLFSQTCGYPLMTELRKKVRLIATPRYNCQGCVGPLYRGAIIVRTDDAATSVSDCQERRCAVNSFTSNSGMNLLRNIIAPLAHAKPFFHSVLKTGAHIESMYAVAQNRADVASIDCVTFAHIQRSMPELKNQIRVLAWTEASPGLPLITAASTDNATLKVIRQALLEIEQAPELNSMRAELLIDGFEILDIDSYQSILELERLAIDWGYPKLA